MASQIEGTLASLTALCEQSMVQIDDLFKLHDRKIETYRSATLATIKKFFRRIESDALASPSPVKSLRKQTRRKAKKSTRARKPKPKSHARPPILVENTTRSNSDNASASQPSVSRSLQHKVKGARTETETELPPSSRLQPLQPTCSKSPGTSAVNSENRTSATKELSPKRFTRSTASFHSAVGSPIQQLPKEKSTDDGLLDEDSTQDMLHSPETGESQWKDCRSKPESVLPLRSKRVPAGKRSQPDLEGEEEPAVAPNLGEPVATENRTTVKVPLSDSDRSKPSKSIPRSSDTELIDHPSLYRPSTSEEEVPSGHTSDSDQVDEGKSAEDGVSHVPVHRRKQGVGRVATGCDLGKDIYDLKGKEERSSIAPFSSDIDKPRLSRKTWTDLDEENSADKGSSTSKHIKNDSESKTNQSSSDKMRNDFEFKAPKPRPPSSIPTSSTRQGAGPAAHTTSDLHRKADPRTHRDIHPNALKQNLVFQKHFAVDEGGKINDTGIGVLSEIAATPSRGNEANGQKNGEERTLRGTKLFKPTTDIYSAQRKPVLSRVLSVQKSDMSSRASLLSHTPGARAPTTRLANHPILTGPSSNSLRESLAALKQPITDSKPSQRKLQGEPGVEATLKAQSNSLLHRDEQNSRNLGKRLTFAHEHKQLDRSPTQSIREIASQPSPAREFRQRRVRGEAEKSVLRRRIEEMRERASTVKKRSSLRSSRDESKLESSTSNPDSGNSDMYGVDSGTSQLHESPKQSQVGNVGREVVDKARKSSGGAANVGVSTRHDWQNAVIADQVCLGNKEEATKRGSGRRNRLDDGMTSGMTDRHDEDKSERVEDAENEQDGNGAKSVLSNLMSSFSSLYPGGSSLLGVRTNEERREETDAEVVAKRQKLDAERREAERLARMEAQRIVRQREAEEKQRRAEARRQLLAVAEKAKEDERKRKEEHRKKVKQQEEEQRRRKKMEEDRKKEERRKQVLEKRAMNMELEWKRKGMMDGKRQRVVKGGGTGIPKPGGLGGKSVKGGGGVGKNIEKQEGEERELGSSYAMTPAKATIIEESDEETERRKHKIVPAWAGERNLAISTRAQPDPDKVFVNMPMCNLREVFGNEKQYRTRSSSANWTQDRVTTSEMTKYKKAVGGFRDV